jgi:hypothetical protein
MLTLTLDTESSSSDTDSTFKPTITAASSVGAKPSTSTANATGAPTPYQHVAPQPPVVQSAATLDEQVMFVVETPTTANVAGAPHSTVDCSGSQSLTDSMDCESTIPVLATTTEVKVIITHCCANKHWGDID